MFRIRTLKRKQRQRQSSQTRLEQEDEKESRPKIIKVKKKIVNMSQDQKPSNLKLKNLKTPIFEEDKTCSDSNLDKNDSMLNSSISCKFSS
jgi:hypothetical protein